MYESPGYTHKAYHLQWYHWLLWIGITLIGAAIGDQALRFVERYIPSYPILIAGASFGLCLSGVQWVLVLRHFLVPPWWILLNIIAGSLGYTAAVHVFSIISGRLGNYHASLIATLIFAAILTLGAVGPLIRRGAALLRLVLVGSITATLLLEILVVLAYS